jgi:tetratricopeptide (TPR) repeat protein
MIDALDPMDVGDVAEWQALAALFREEAGLAGNPRRAARHLVEFGRIHEEQLGDLEAARAAYEEAHVADPTDVACLRALRRIAERTSDWNALKLAITRELEAAPTDLDRAVLHLRMAVLLSERFSDLADAREHLRTAAELAPDDPEILLRLELVTPEDDAATRVELLGRRLRLTEAPGARTNILLEMGRLTETALESDEDALSLYREALDVTPGSRDAIEGIVRLYLRAGRSAELVATLMQLVTEVTDQELRGRMMYLSAVLNMTRLEQFDRAPLLLGQAAVLLSHDPTVVRELIADYESLGMWGPANALLEALAGQEGGVLGAVSLYRAGLNTEAGLGNAAQALDFYRRALALAPGFAPGHAAERRISLRTGDETAMLGAVDALANLADDPATRAVLIGYTADVLEARHPDTGGGGDEILRRWQAALTAASHGTGPLGDTAPIQAARRLLIERRGPAELARVLETWLTRPLETDARRAALAALAEVLEIQLDDARGAVRTLQQLVECAPDDTSALRSLQRLCAQIGDLPGVISAAEREMTTLDDRPRKLALLLRNAEMLEELGEPRRAEDAWRRALALEPRFLPALIGLGRLLYHHGRWHDLAALHRHELDHLGAEESERAGVLGRLAELYEFRLEQLDEAAACYEEILAIRPKAPDALAGLERLYGARDRWPELARVLRQRAEHVDEPRDRAVLLFRLGEIEHESLGDLESALDHYEAALEHFPGLTPANWALERLVVAIGDRERQVMLFRGLLARSDHPAQRAMLAHKLALLLSPADARPVYQELMEQGGEEPAALWALYREAAERGDRAEVAERLSRLAQWVHDRRDALLLWREAAENAEEAGREVDDAFCIGLWERVLALEPTGGRAWEALHRRRRRVGDQAEYAAFLVRLGRAADDERTASITRWSAGLLYDRLGGDDALSLYREAAGLCAEDPVPVWLLLTAAERAGVDADRAELQVELAGRRLAHAAAASELTAAGLYFADTAGDRARGLACLLEAVRRDPMAHDAAARAETLLREDAQLTELAGFLQRRLRRLQSPDDVIPVARRLAALQLGPMGDLAGARETLERLAGYLPDDFEIRWQLAESMALASEPRAAVLAYEDALAIAPGDADRARAHTRIGQLRARRLGDLQGAVEALRTAVGLLDPHGEALEELAAIYLLVGEASSALLAYERLERLVNDAERRRDAQAGQIRALIAGGRLADARARLAEFRRLAPGAEALGSLAQSLDELDPQLGDDIMVTDPSGAPLPLLTGPIPPVPPPMPMPPVARPMPLPPVETPPVDPDMLIEVEDLHEPAGLAFAPTGPVPVVTPGRPPSARATMPPPLPESLTATAITMDALPMTQTPVQASGGAAMPPVRASLPPPVISAPPPPPPPPPVPSAPSGDIRQTVPYGLPAMPLSAPLVPETAETTAIPDVAPPVARREQSGAHETEMGMPVARGVVGRIEPVLTEVDPVLLVRGARTRIEADPLDVHAWRDLVRATAQRGHVAAARWYEDGLSWLEGELVPAQPSTPPGPLPDGLRRPLLPPTVPASVLMLLRQVGPWVTPPFCADAGRHGVTASDLVSDNDPLSGIARRMAEILGVDAWMMLRNPSRPYTVAVEAGDPSSIVLGSAILDGAPDTARSFLVARCLVPLGEGTLLARKLTDREFGAFLAALLGILGAEFPVRARDRATFDRMRAQLEPALPANRRTSSLTDLARASAQSLQSLPAAALRAGLETYAARLALAITDGCGGALEMLRRQDFDDRPRTGLNRADLVQFVADSDTARDLLVFASSPACEAVRSWLAGER